MISTLAPIPAQNAAQALDRVRIGAFRRGEDAPAVDEQFGKNRKVGAGMLCAGDRMRGNEVHGCPADKEPCRAPRRP